MQITISAPDRTLAADLQHRIDRKTKPVGALGRLEALALQLGLVQQTLRPEIRQPHIMVFAGDHGAARAGISAYPQDVTWQMVENFLAGGAAINVFSRQMGLGLTVIDAGVNHEFGQRAGLIGAKVGNGTENYLEQPAMSAEQRDAALSRGRELAHALAANGCNVVGFGEMGIGNTAAASLLTHCLTGTDLATVTGRGTGLDDAGLARKRELLGQALARGGRPTDPLQALAEYGGFEIAMMAGAMLGAAEKGMVLLIDGFIVTSALLVAQAIAPEILGYCVFAHRSQEAGHAAQLKHFGADPLVSLDLRLGEGTGAALAFPLLQAAANFLNEMASFDSAGVSDKSA
ncbi:MAG TPA: nicotinate-nucleotide--dimethylbenzimidazole phosphoribosyltransferase [Aromatoleum sp.]|uniref:nicotinate-nucleotide--dimethylbenzimidazole phosphoribosyltransferase n=1 Tax=Aromatoleum sp. TaxID=2307007 RepID=UPI002B49A519|nr:nicotinate-nucleotide--dimethylbenzimidazole phosphoribosyltransferase [Aromatoleum sp.]HJV28403.1 nicotinate-nucleotide--dimethylbenzimidazole phosphoribosyltransferase [Aromatoleum sp.]